MANARQWILERKYLRYERDRRQFIRKRLHGNLVIIKRYGSEDFAELPCGGIEKSALVKSIDNRLTCITSADWYAKKN